MKQINKEVFEKAIASLSFNNVMIVDEQDPWIVLTIDIDLQMNDFFSEVESVRVKIKSILERIMTLEGFTSDLTNIDYISSLDTANGKIYVSFEVKGLERWIFDNEYNTVDAFMVIDKTTNKLLCVLEDYDEAYRYVMFCNLNAEIKVVPFRPTQKEK